MAACAVRYRRGWQTRCDNHCLVVTTSDDPIYCTACGHPSKVHCAGNRVYCKGTSTALAPLLSNQNSTIIMSNHAYAFCFITRLEALLHYLITANLDKTTLGSHFLCNLDTRTTIRLFHSIIRLFREDDFNVSRLTGVLSDPSVGTVGSTAPGRGAVDLSVGNDQLFRVQTLGFRVGHGVRQQIPVDLGGLNGPASRVSRGLVLLGLGGVSDTAGSVFGTGALPVAWWLWWVVCCFSFLRVVLPQPSALRVGTGAGR